MLSGILDVMFKVKQLFTKTDLLLLLITLVLVHFNSYAVIRAKSTDREPTVSSQSEGSGKMALWIVKYIYIRPFQPIGVSFFAVSCRGPEVIRSQS